MRREHPLRILRYSLKNLWLLIFPIIRGAYHFATKEDVIAYLRGTWFELLILLVIFGYGWLNWFFRKFIIENEQIYVREGILFARKKYMPVRNLSALTLEHPLWLQPFRGAYVYADTASGILERTDIKLLIRQSDEKLFVSSLPRLRKGKRHHFSQKAGLWRILLFSIAFSNSFTGSLYMATFWFQGGRIARDLLEQFQVTERLSTVSEEVARRLMGIPPAAVMIGLIILSTWMLSFLSNLIRYGGFDMESDKRMLSVRSGLATRRHFYLVSHRINFIDIRQNLLTKCFRICSLAVNCPGFGNQRGSIPICLPLLTQKEMEEALPMIFPGSRQTKNRLKTPGTSWFSYIFLPVLAAVCVIPVLNKARELFPQVSEVLTFLQIMIEIPILWKLAIQLVALLTTGISGSKGRICVRYCRGLTFHTVIADTDSVVKVKIKQLLWQKLSGKCHVELYFRSEVTKRCILRSMKLEMVRTQLSEILESGVPVSG